MPSHLFANMCRWSATSVVALPCLLLPASAASRQLARFDLRDIDIERAAAVVQHFTGLPVMLEKGVTGAVTLVSGDALDRRQAASLLVTAAQSRGWSVQPDGRGGLAILFAAPAVPVAAVADDGKFTARTYRLQHKGVAEVSPRLRPLLSERGSIGAADEHGLVLYDQAHVHAQVVHILAEIDTADAPRYGVARLKAARADEVLGLLRRWTVQTNEILPAGLFADAASNTLLWEEAGALADGRLRGMIGAIEREFERAGGQGGAGGNTESRPARLSAFDTDAGQPLVLRLTPEIAGASSYRGAPQLR